MNEVSSDFPLIYRGIITGDLNRTDITPGYYSIGSPGTVQNLDHNIGWAVFIQFNVYKTQLVINGSQRISRKFSGSPSSWSPWG